MAGAYGPGFMNQVLQPVLGSSMDMTGWAYLQGKKALEKGYGEAKGYQQPWYDYGTDTLGDFRNWLSDPTAVTSDPSYQWRLNQGTQALENSAAARGGLLSGNTARAISDYGQRSASQEYANQFNRWLQQLGIGQTAAGNMSGLSAQQGNALANLFTGYGDTQFNQTLASAEAIRNAENTFNNILQSWIPSSFGGGGSANQSIGGGF